MKKIFSEEPDDQLLARRAMKDRRAAEELLLRVRPRVRRAIRIMVGNDRDAEDLVNQTLLEVLESAGRYKGTGTLEAWAGRIAFHVVAKHMKRRWRKEKVMVPETREMGVASSNPEREASTRRARDQVEIAMRRLPEERRTTLVLRLVFGHSIAEIGALTGVPVNTVRGRIRTGLKELRGDAAAQHALVMVK